MRLIFPAGWNTYLGDCYANSTNSATPPAQTIAALGQMKVDGAIAGVLGADDMVTLAILDVKTNLTTVYSASGDNHFPDLTNGWRISEFNVFGDGGGSTATFNAGSTIVVRTSANSGMPATLPTCALEGFTGETNNLTLVSTPSIEPDVTWPSIVFT